MSSSAPDPDDDGQNATDPDGDSLYEDVNGNGRYDFHDVALFLEELDSLEIQHNISLFDFDGSGSINIIDTAVLFGEVQTKIPTGTSTAIDETIRIENATLAPGERTTVNITLSAAPDGIAGYNLSVSIADPSVATITGIDETPLAGPDWRLTSNNGTAIGAAAGAVNPGATDILLATVTVETAANATGATTLDVTLRQLDDDNGTRIAPAVRDGTVDVVVPTGTLSATVRDTTGAPVTTDDDGVGVRFRNLDNGSLIRGGDINATTFNLTATGDTVATTVAANRSYRAELVVVDPATADAAGLGNVNATSPSREVAPGESITLNATVTRDATAERTVAVALRPANDTTSVNRNITFDVVIRNASTGVGAYDLTVNTSDTGTATVVDATDRTGGGASIGVAPTGASFRVIDANTSNGTVTVATVTVTGVSEGTATLSLSVDTIGDRNDTRYVLAGRADATVTVERVTAPDVNGDGTSATDPDGDGFYEDVTGDGNFNIIDVSVLLDRFESTPVQESVALFDFKTDGQVDILDVSVLLSEA